MPLLSAWEQDTSGSSPAGARLPIRGWVIGDDISPDARLLKYYLLGSLLIGPFFWVILIPSYFRYHTLRYRFDEEGVSMRWGILFRREITLNYARIQDIHLTSNIVERWLGLAKIQIQTASGSASAEMTIEGLPEYEAIRDFLYIRMRGARERGPGRAAPVLAHVADPVAPGTAGLAELTETLRDVAAELRALRVEMRGGGAPDPGGAP
jgi:membrane protein YdbS with pleckstrin-like domain